MIIERAGTDVIHAHRGETLDAFTQTFAAWQTFFIALAGIGATLAGLLFVAISLHPANKDVAAKTNLRRMAEHTFADLVQVLFIGVCFAAPGQIPLFYAIVSLVIVVAGVREPARRLWETWRDQTHDVHRKHFMRRLGLSLLGRGLLLAGGVMLYLFHGTGPQVEQAMMFFFSGGLVLLISGMRNAWFLILQEAV
jgi:hypothetical protein